MLALTMMILAGASAAEAQAGDCPNAVSTVEINGCLAGELDRANAELHRYVMAAGKRVRQDSDGPGAAAGFDKAEAAWAAYREAECGAVYDYWSGGTIRGAMSLTCRIDLTRAHTHRIWSLWLTYMDSTPPILPEPRTSAGR